MSSPFLPPTQTTGVVPPNRARPASMGKTLLIWLLLIVIFVALYRFFGSEPHRAPKLEPVDPSGSPIGWLVPLLTYAAMVGLLLLVRRRLPEKYRSGELRELPRPAEAKTEPTGSPPAIDLALDGTDGRRRVRLAINDAGIYWHAEPRLLLPAQELRVPWDELESIRVLRPSAPLLIWGIMLGIFSATYAVYADTPGAFAGVAVGLAIAFLGRARARGMLTFTTATHAMTFQSRKLDSAVEQEVLAATRARRPRAIAPPSPPNQRGAFWLLFVEPFVHLTLAFRSDPALRAHLLRQQSITPDAVCRDPGEEAARASVVQCRLFSLWSGFLCGIGPLSFGLGAIVAGVNAASLFIPWFVAWLLGRIIISKSMPAFARFSGMTLLRPQ